MDKLEFKIVKILAPYLKAILDSKIPSSDVEINTKDSLKNHILEFWMKSCPFNRISDTTLQACIDYLLNENFICKSFNLMTGNSILKFNVKRISDFLNAYYSSIPQGDFANNNDTNKLILSWNKFQKFIEDAVNHLHMTAKTYSGIYGLPRGGLIPAVVLSHYMHLPLLQAPAKDCIIVDDIDDTGITLQHYVKNEDYKVITWVFRESLDKIYHWNGLTIDHKVGWVVFPWENPDD